MQNANRNLNGHLLSVHHIAIICSDYARSRAFYTEILGLEILNETYRAERDSYKLDLKISDDCAIELFSFPHPPARPSRPEAQGLRHLAFRVDNIKLATEYLQAQGVVVEPIRTDDITGQRYTFFHDPDGLPLELYECPYGDNEN